MPPGVVMLRLARMSLSWPYLLWLSYPLYWWRRLIGLDGEQLNLANTRKP